MEGVSVFAVKWLLSVLTHAVMYVIGELNYGVCVCVWRGMACVQFLNRNLSAQTGTRAEMRDPWRVRVLFSLSLSSPPPSSSRPLPFFGIGWLRVRVVVVRADGRISPYRPSRTRAQYRRHGARAPYPTPPPSPAFC